jgi:hypothetical protein
MKASTKGTLKMNDTKQKIFDLVKSSPMGKTCHELRRELRLKFDPWAILRGLQREGLVEQEHSIATSQNVVWRAKEEIDHLTT